MKQADPAGTTEEDTDRLKNHLSSQAGLIIRFFLRLNINFILKRHSIKETFVYLRR